MVPDPQHCSELVLWIRIGLNADPDPGLGWPKLVKFYNFANLLSHGLHEGRPSYRKSQMPSKGNIQHIYNYVGHFCPPGSGPAYQNQCESDPFHNTAVNITSSVSHLSESYLLEYIFTFFTILVIWNFFDRFVSLLYSLACAFKLFGFLKNLLDPDVGSGFFLRYSFLLTST